MALQKQTMWVAAAAVASQCALAAFVYSRQRNNSFTRWINRITSGQLSVPQRLSAAPKYAIIGGSGVEIKVKERYAVDTPYGRCVNISFLNDRVVFVNRHTCTDSEEGGFGTYAPPHAINFRAMLWALKELNVSHICAISSTGTLHPADFPVGSIVMPDDYFMTQPKPVTFWPHPLLAKMDRKGESVKGHPPKIGQIHYSPANPHDTAWVRWRAHVQGCLSPLATAHQLTFATDQTTTNWPCVGDPSVVPMQSRVVYVNTQGPRFESRAEIRSYRAVGSVVGMTCGNEWILAEELQIPYALVSAIDNSCNGLSQHPKGPLQEYLDNKQKISEVTGDMVRTLAASLASADATP